jgi:tetratricopeptide (TPR) repeat protein
LADDLSVAYSKLGRNAEAITLLEQVLAAHPDRYETLANLGTIHMLAGDLNVGREYIDRTIVVNPDAHFGREKYQSLLAEYFLTKRKSPHPASESTLVIRPKGDFYGFANFVLAKKGFPSHVSTDDVGNDTEGMKAELAAAQKGVLGMMHFANYDSPLLLEALGDLLIAWPTYGDDALQLAARAYYRIAQLSSDAGTKDEFKKAAAHMVAGHQDYIGYRKQHADKDLWPDTDLEKLSTELDRELAEGEAYFERIAADERRWIAAGVDVDQAFAATYYDSLEGTIEEAQKQLASERRDERGNPYEEAQRRAMLILAGIAAGLVALVWGCLVVRRRL